MREILFRGKRDKRYGDDWTYGVPYIDHEGDCIMATHCSKRVVIPETVGQYTGLTDKNGNKIFEGDIVRLTFSEEVVGKIICDINYYFEVYLFGKTTHKSLSDYLPYALEILGNIHDNPELLEVESVGGSDE